MRISLELLPLLGEAKALSPHEPHWLLVYVRPRILPGNRLIFTHFIPHLTYKLKADPWTQASELVEVLYQHQRLRFLPVPIRPQPFF